MKINVNLRKNEYEHEHKHEHDHHNHHDHHWVGNSLVPKNIKEMSYISRKQKLFKLAPLLSLASSSCRKASTGRRKASSIPQE